VASSPPTKWKNIAKRRYRSEIMQNGNFSIFQLSGGLFSLKLLSWLS
jgi:hypothetical protein